MSQDKVCPRCDLVNPSNCQRCKCGYDFLTAEAMPPGPRDKKLGGWGCFFPTLFVSFYWVLLILGLCSVSSVNRNRHVTFPGYLNDPVVACALFFLGPLWVFFFMFLFRRR